VGFRAMQLCMSDLSFVELRLMSDRLTQSEVWSEESGTAKCISGRACFKSGTAMPSAVGAGAHVWV